MRAIRMRNKARMTERDKRACTIEKNDLATRDERGWMHERGWMQERHAQEI